MVVCFLVCYIGYYCCYYCIVYFNIYIVYVVLFIRCVVGDGGFIGFLLGGNGNYDLNGILWLGGLFDWCD